MKKITQNLMFLLLFVTSFGYSQKVAVIGTNHLTPDGFTFLVTQDLGSGEVIYFTENEYNDTSNAFDDQAEATVAFTAGSIILKGTVVFVNETATDTFSVSCTGGGICGTAVKVPTSGFFSLASDGETFYAYSDTDNNPANGVTTIHSVMFTGDTAPAIVNGGPIPVNQNPSFDYPTAIVIDGFPAVQPNRVEFNPTAPDRTNVTKVGLENPSNYVHAQANAALSTIFFTNFNLTGSNPTLTVTASPTSVAENSGTGMVYTFSLSANAGSNLTVNFNVGGSAVFSTDYTQTGAATYNASTGTVTILSGSNSATITITPSGDSSLEPNETVVLTLTAGTGYDAGSPGAATTTIVNDDTSNTDPLVALTGISHTDPDGFSFVAVSDIPANTVVYFTENSYNNTTLLFGTGEAVMQWTSPASVTPKGNVIVVTETAPDTFAVTCSSGGCGTIALLSGNLAIATTGETNYAYSDTDSNPSNGVTDIYSVLFTGTSTVSGGAIPGIEDPSTVYTNAVVVDGFPATAPLRTEYDPTKRAILVTEADFENVSNWIHGQAPPALSTVPFALLNISCSTPPTPTFTQVGPICTGDTLSALPTTSNNGIMGTWAPALNNTTTTEYTFTPDLGQCGTTTTMTITVNPIVTPTFTQVAPICTGDALSALPTTSNNSITGTWVPALDNTTTTTYTFTPNIGQCTATATMTITVNSIPTVDITQPASACEGDTTTITATVSAVSTINGFIGVYDVANWAFTNTNANGNVNTTGAPSSISLTGGDNQSNAVGNTDFTITIPSNATISFNWSYSTPDGAQFDIPRVIVNGTPTVLTGYSTGVGTTPQSGSMTVALSAGDTFRFNMNTVDNRFGAATVTISNLVISELPTLLWTAAAGGTIVGTNNGLSVAITTSGTYTLTATNGNCIGSDTVSLVFNTLPTVNTITNQTVCNGSATTATTFSGTPIIPQAYTVSPFNSTLYTIPTTTYQATTEVTATLAGFTVLGMNSISYDPSTSQYYVIVRVGTGATPRRLGTINPLTGVITDIGSLGDRFSGLTFSNTGNLWGVTGNGATCAECLYTINKTTATPTFIKVLGSGADGEVILFNPADGFLYHWSGNSTVEFEKLDTTLYNETPIGTYSSGVGSGEVFGASIDPLSGDFIINDISSNVERWTISGPVSQIGVTKNISGIDIDVRGFVVAPNASSSTIYNWTNDTTSIGLAASGSGDIPSFTAINSTTTAITATITVTPSLNGCDGTPVQYTITVNPTLTPTFTQVAPICVGGTLSPLPTTSNNGITGTWSPAINAAVTTTYTFTTDASQCVDSTVVTMTIVVNPLPTVGFTANPFPICAGTSSVLTANVTNATPTISTSSQTFNMNTALFGVPVTSPLSGILALAPSNGCAAFAPGLFTGKIALIIRGGCPFATKVLNAQNAGAIGVIIYNNVAGALIPGGVDPTITIPVYGISQADGQALIVAMTANEVNVTLTPAPLITYLWGNGETTQSITTGVLNADTNFTVTVTNTVTGCTATVPITVPVTPNTIPTFTQVAAICTGGTLALLPLTSDNGIAGTWSPALDITTTTTYTFTPTPVAGQCLGTATMTITVNQPTAPVFTQVAPLCVGGTTTLPTTSNNGFTGTWAPAIDNTVTTTYTFTPDAGQCVDSSVVTMTIVVNPLPTVAFTANPFPICAGTSSVLTANVANATPTISTSSQTFNMNPAAFGVPVTSPLSGILALAPSNGCVAFAPGLFTGKIALIQRGGCAFTVKAQNAQDAGAIGVILYNNVAGAIIPIGVAPGITIPVYGMTLADGQALIAAMTAGEVNVTLTPQPPVTYLWGNGETTQSITTGVLNVDTNFTVTVTNTVTGCTATVPITVPVTPNTIPTFTQVSDICTGGTLAPLPTTSDNGVAGTWSPALDNTTTTTYTFTPTPVAGQCLGIATMTITVISAPAPTGDANQTISVGNANDATLASLVVSPTNVIWYATLADAQSGTNPLSSTTVLTNGSTYYAVNVVGACSSTPLAVTVTVVLGNEEFDNLSFAFWPNPTSSIINISYSKTITQVSVTNVLGQQVLSKNTNATEVQIDLSRLAEATYFIRVQSEDAERTIKVIKKN